jgi:hypothetical protein
MAAGTPQILVHDYGLARTPPINPMRNQGYFYYKGKGLYKTII